MEVAVLLCVLCKLYCVAVPRSTSTMAVAWSWQVCSVHVQLSRVVAALLSLVVSRPLVPGSHLFSAGWPEEYITWLLYEMTPGSVSAFCTSWFDSGNMFGVSLCGIFE